MYRVLIIDKKNLIADGIRQLEVWNLRREFQIIKVMQEEDALDYIKENDIEIVFVAMYNHCQDKLKHFERLIKECKQTYFVFICEDYHFQNVRNVFRIGAFDYLQYPLGEAEVSESLRRIEKSYYSRFIPAGTIKKIDALIDNIFLGGGNEQKICEDIIKEIYEDEGRDVTEKQIMIKNVKEKIYLDMIYRKPWLEKFIWDQKFLYKGNFHIEDEARIMESWKKDFAEVAKVIRKYQMLDNRLIYHIGKYIVVHVDERLTLEDLSKSVYLNKSYISHIFKKVSGMSLKEFMADVKMDRARILLLDKDRKIYEIAETLGYNDVEYFRKKFKDITGISPTEYRKN
jgi:two-component system response regulator YesN